MRTLLLVAVLATIVAPMALGAGPGEADALLRVAARLSGLEPKGRVKFVVETAPAFDKRRLRLLERAYPTAAQAYDETLFRALGLMTGRGALRRTLIEMDDRRGLYDPVARTAYVSKGPTERATLVHELVHGLQDQHYNLKRSAMPRSRDARFAAAAAIEGHATLASSVIGTDAPQLRGGSRLQTFLELERGFAYATGASFAGRLRNLGGNHAIRSALVRFPETSEQVFHIGAFLQRERAAAIVLPVDAGGLTLTGDDTFGELDVRALLAVFGVPRLDHVGTGWGGGRTAVYRSADGHVVLLALDWDTARDAAEWAEAVQVYVNEAFDADEPGLPGATPCKAGTCWTVGGRTVAFRRVGARTALAISSVFEAADAVASSIVPAA